jgi:hypothetical protein
MKTMDLRAQAQNILADVLLTHWARVWQNTFLNDEWKQ